MNDEKIYLDEKGVQWNREFTVPHGVVSTKIDPFSSQQFIDKIGASSNQKMGDIWDRSAELSAKRADKAGGIDPVKEQSYKEYSKKRKGKISPHQQREELAKKKFTL